MKCLQCGAELNGNKFCTNCGAPAEVCVQSEQNVVIDTENNTYENLSDAVNQTVDYQNPYADNTQPVLYNANTNQPNIGYTGQQFTNNPNGTYAGQQFTNQPNVAPSGKKSMDSGKLAIIIISIVVGLIIILGIIVGVIAFSLYNIAKDAVISYEDNLSSVSSYLSSYIDDYSSSVDDYSSSLDDESLNSAVIDPLTDIVYKKSKLYDGWAVIGYDNYEYPSNEFTLEIPEQFMGEDVVEIQDLSVLDLYDNKYITVIIPGTVKVIGTYGIAGHIDEVVIKDGVQKIGNYTFTYAGDLSKIHIPSSVTTIPDTCGLDVCAAENKNGLTIYCAKDSEAEKYAKEHNINYKIE
ncbi:MAG: leucine-rich repeat protein [Ruminococcus sp.]|nr:leucine-rich repeat protein [Ruminococcus sp.]